MSSTLEKIIQLASAVVIIFEHAFYLWDQKTYHVQGPDHPVCIALQQYMASPNVAAVKEALNSAVHTYEAGFAQWIPGSAKRSQKQAGLIETITRVVLQHRLPRPEV